MTRLLLHILGLAPLAELRTALDALHAARTEAELLRVQVEYQDAVIAVLKAGQAVAPGVMWRVERAREELN